MTGTNHSAARRAKRLLASIHDVDPESAAAVERPADHLARHRGAVTKPGALARIDAARADFARKRDARPRAALLAA